MTRLVQVEEGPVDEERGHVTRPVQVGGPVDEERGHVTRPVQVGGPVDEDGRTVEVERNSVTPLSQQIPTGKVMIMAATMSDPNSDNKRRS